MLIAQLTKEEIIELSKRTEITSVDLYEELICFEEPEIIRRDYWNSIDTCFNINDYYDVADLTQLNGSGVTIGILDSDTPGGYEEGQIDESKLVVLGNELVRDGSHAANTVNILIGPGGIARGINKVYCTAHWASSFFDCLELLVENGVTVINGSFMNSYRNNNAYHSYEKWFDYMIDKHQLTVIMSAGNGANKSEVIKHPLWVPAGSYNAITVGAMHDNYSTEKDDDSVFDYSSYDTQGGCSKPDFIAPANLGGGGTSSSAPVVTGLVAMMLQLKPSLSAHPQVIKAILMASCHRKGIDPVTDTQTETMEAGITEKQGAGIIDPYIALSIVANKQYGQRELSGSQDYIYFVQPKYDGTKMNVSVAWNLPYSEVDQAGMTRQEIMAYNKQICNIDMKVYKDGGELIASSKLPNSSTEMAYIPLNNDTKEYKINVYKENCLSSSITYGYAWSTDDITYQIPSKTGLYFIRNQHNNLSLDVDTAGCLYQNSFTGNESQKWVVKKAVKEGCFKLLNDTCVGDVGFSSSYNSIPVPVKMVQSGVVAIEFKENDDDTISLNLYHPEYGFSCAVQPESGSATVGTKMAWANISETNNLQRWYFSKVNYRQGDINQDGCINNSDYIQLCDCVENKNLYTESEKYLADMNRNNRLDEDDIALFAELYGSFGL